MKIKFLGHSCFKLTESTGTTIVTDPYNNVGFDMAPVDAEVVTVSHGHYDHNNVKAVSGVKKVFDKEGSYEYGGVKILGIKSFHDENNGKDRGENIIFKYRMDGLDICHMGDIGERFSPEMLSMILPVNILLIPVGGNYTIDAEMAKEYVDAIMPEVVIPMHYKARSTNIDIKRAQEFIDLFDDEMVDIPDVEEIEFTRDDIDNESTKIVLFKRARS